LLLAAGLAIRLGYLVTPDLDSDQAIFGLMGRHILQGELPVFQWGYQYMGTIESFVAAPLMLVFGPTRFALDLSPVLFNMLFLYAVYLYAREAAGPATGLWALAFASMPPCFLIWSVVVAAGAYSETLALGTLAAWLALRIPAAEDRVAERRILVTTGVILGLSFWTHLNTTIYLAAILSFLCIERPEVFKRIYWLVGAFLAGSLPFWIGTIQSRFATFAIATLPEPPFSSRLGLLVSYRLPIVLGIHYDRSRLPTLPAFGWLLLFIQLGALSTLVTFARSPTPSPLRGAARLLLWIGAAFFVAYLGSPFSGADTQRYLIPLYTVLSIAPALLIAYLGGATSRGGIVVGVLVLALQTIPTIGAMRVLHPKAFRQYRQERDQEMRLLRAIDSLGLKAVYVDDYWDGARLTFDDEERVLFPRTFDDRNHTYLDAADSDSRSAFLFHFPPNAAAFTGTLKLAGARYRKTNIEGYQLFYDVESAPGDGPRLSVVGASASRNAVDAPLAIDQDAGTRWESMGPQEAGMWFQVDLETEQEVAEVDFWPGLAWGTPRGLRVEASLDGGSWTTVAEAAQYYGPCSWARGRPVPEYQGWVVARFQPIRCRSLRVTDLGNDRYSWTIVELEVRGPGKLRAHSIQEMPRAEGERLFADPVLAALLPGGVRHWQGRPIPRFKDLRDADIVAPTDRVMLTSDAPLVRDGTDRSIGVRADRISRIGNEAIVDGLHLDTDGLERRVAMLRDERRSNKAVLELHAETEVSGVVVEHREAASSFPRGLVARTSEDGVTWGASEVLRPHPTGLIWSGKGLMGASLTERMFLFARPHSTRFIELTAEPRHPSFPWIVRKASVLVRR